MGGEKNLDSKRDNAWDTWDSFTNEKIEEVTHVMASFIMHPITFCEASNKDGTFPITISSPTKEKTCDFANPSLTGGKLEAGEQ